MSSKQSQGSGRSGSRGSKTRVVVDYKVLGISLLVLALLGGAGLWRYRQQTRANAVVLLENAKKHEEAGEWKKAAKLYFDYLRLRPDDKAVNRDLALAYEKSAETLSQKERAVQLLFFALGLNSDDESQLAMRMPLANRLTELNQYDRVTEVLKDIPDTDPRVRQLRVLAKYNSTRSGDDVTRGNAFRELVKAFLEKPVDVKTAEIIAEDAKMLSRRLSTDEYEKLASQCMLQLVSSVENQKNSSAWLASYRFNREFDPKQAKMDAQRSVDFAVSPEEKVKVSQVVLASIDPTEDAKVIEQQLTRLEEMLRPVVGKGGLKTAEAYLTLGGVLSMLNRQEDAIKLWEEGLAGVKPGDGANASLSSAAVGYLAFQLANAKLALGDKEAARKYLQQSTKASDELLKFAGLSDAYKQELDIFRKRIQLLNFRLMIAEGNVSETISQMVEMVKTSPAVIEPGPARDFAYELYSVLGSAYERSSQWELAAQNYEAATQYASRPNDISAQLASRCWMQAGNESKALGTILDSVSRAATEDARAVGPMLQLAELSLQQQMNLPEKDRNWTDFENALKTAEQKEPKAWQVPVLRAVRLIEGKTTKEPGQVKALLARAEDVAPDSLEMWFQVASIYQRLEDLAERDRAVEAYEKLEDKEWARTFMKARLAASDREFVEAAKMGAGVIPSLPEVDRPSVWRQVAAWYDLAGDQEMAQKTLVEAHAALPDNIELARMLADSYLTEPNWKKLEQVEGELKTMEGEDGVLWRLYRAYRLVRNNEGDPAVRRADAGKLLNELTEKLPAWPTPYALKGELLESHGFGQDAVEQLETAVQLGDRRIETFESLVRILVGLGEFEKANRYTGMLQARLSSSPMLVGLAAESLRKGGNLEGEIERVRALIEVQPNDISKRLWLAKLLEMNKDRAAAEKEYREAVKAAPEDPTAWLGLFEFYVVRSPETAAKLIDRMDRVMNSVPLERRTLLMSRCLSSVGRTEEAAQRLREASQSLPESSALRLELGRLLMATSPEEAEKNLRELVKKDPEDNASKQMLAMVLATNGGAEGWKEAVSLLNGSKRDAVNQRLEAILLANRGQADEMARSREILKDLVRQSERFEPMDHRLLAMINESLGDAAAAETEYKALVSQPGLNLDDLGRYVDFLLRRNATDEAAKVLKVLDEKSAKASIPGRLRFVERQAKYWKEVGQTERVDSLLREFTDRVVAEAGPQIENPRAAAYGTAGRLAISIEQFDQAEKWIRRLVEILPSEKWQLAEVMAHQGRYEEGLEVLMPAKSGEAVPDTETCIRLLNFLSIGEPPADVWKRTEPIWESWLKDSDLRKQMAGVAAMVVGRKMDVATENLDKLVTSHPNDPMVLNNAATVFGEVEGRREDGLKLVDRAIELSGPLPFLLDTKSLILVEMGRQKEAVDLLKHFINQPYADSRVLFRLAIAEYKSNNSKGALAAYERARAAGLGSQILSVQDRTHVRELELLRREAASNKTSRTDRSRPQAA